MSSKAIDQVLQMLQALVYSGVFLASLVHSRRHRGAASAWLMASFGVLAAVVLAGQVLPEEPGGTAYEWITKALIAVLVLFPYCLYRFTASMIRPARWVDVAAVVLTGSVAILPLFFPPLPRGDAPVPTWAEVYVVGLLTQWVFLSGVVAVRLWRAGRRQPTVARRRMRTMSVGAIGLALALVVGGELGQNAATDIAVGTLVLVAGPLMLVGFAPPRILRVVWRRGEEADLRDAARSLIRATTTAEVAHTLLPHARRLVGAAAASIEAPDGSLIASDGTVDAPDLTGRPVIRVPLRIGQLVVVTSPFTPFFGNDEVGELRGLAAQADLALTRNELLESQQRLAAIVEHSHDAILSTTLDGVITSWNRGAERIYGYSPTEMIGEQLRLLMPTGFEDASEGLAQVAPGTTVEHYETTRKTKDGRTIDVSLTISPIKDAEGNVIGLSRIARDVSERKQIEAEREAAREEADRANQAKSEFLSRMSHELRTPLNAVLGFAQLLELDPLVPAQRDATNEILKAGQHLLELIDEVLDLSRIEAGRLRLSLEPVDVIQVAEECLSLLRPQAQQESIGLTLSRQAEGPVFAVADRQRLKQILLNLLSNSIKYNRERGTVDVVIARVAGNERIRIDVTDTGYGIPADRIEHLFEPFERLGAEGSEIEGTGLGLALTRPLVEVMGGSISVMSAYEEGSTFSVELVADPSTETEDALGPDTRSPDSTPTGHTVLYVEDNLANLKLMERVLARRPGIGLVSAMQGRLGVTLARAHRPDLIFLDQNLPDMSGLEVLRRLRADPGTGELPIVVISADASDGLRRRMFNAGASEFVTKPFDVDRLLEILDVFCGDGSDADGTPRDNGRSEPVTSGSA
jgi:PAS domain S-box-containing protein